VWRQQAMKAKGIALLFSKRSALIQPGMKQQVKAMKASTKDGFI
jgi:hypothetical protein